MPRRALGDLLFAATLSVAACATTSAVAGAPVVGKPAPNFRATLFDRKIVSLADYKGEVLILNFWATWCGPCKTELPLLDAYTRIAQSHGLRVLAVASDDSVSDYALRPLAAKLTFPLVTWMGGPYHDLNAYPTNYVIDRQGVLRYAKAGAFTLDELNAVVLPLLNEPRPPSTETTVDASLAKPSS